MSLPTVVCCWCANWMNGLGLSALITENIMDDRRGKNTQLPLQDQLRQSIYSRLAGYETRISSTTAELYDPSSGTFSYTASLTDLREKGQGINLLNDGVVLVTGGNWYYNGRPRLWNTAEIYH